MQDKWNELYTKYIKSGKKDKELWKQLQALDKQMDNNGDREVEFDKGCTT